MRVKHWLSFSFALALMVGNMANPNKTMARWQIVVSVDKLYCFDTKVPHGANFVV